MCVAVPHPIEHRLPRHQQVEEKLPFVIGQDFDAAPQQPGGLGEGVHRSCPAPRPEVPPPGGDGIGGEVVVSGDQPGVLVGSPVAFRHLFHPLGRLGVVSETATLEHAVVGHVAQQRMLEEEFPGVVEGRSPSLVDDLRDRSRSSDVPTGTLLAPVPASTSTASSQKTLPITAACCRAWRSSGASVSSRA